MPVLFKTPLNRAAHTVRRLLERPYSLGSRGATETEAAAGRSRSDMPKLGALSQLLERLLDSAEETERERLESLLTALSRRVEESRVRSSIE